MADLFDDLGIVPGEKPGAKPQKLKPYHGEIEAFLDAPPGLKPYHGQIEAFLDSPAAPKQNTQDGGFIASAKQMAGSTIKGAGQFAADFIPGVDQDNALKRYGQSVVDANPTAVQSFGDIADRPGTAVAEAAGNAGSSIAGMIGVRALGQGITALSPFTGPAAPIVAGAGQAISWGGPVLMAALPSFGGIRERQIQNDPGNENSAASKALAAGGAATVGLIESRFGPQEWATRAMTKAGRDRLAEQFAAKSLTGAIGKGMAKGAAIEGAEELAQNPIEQLAAYEDPRTAENLRETAFGGAMGALGGGVFGGGFGAASRMGRQQSSAAEPAPQDVQPVYDSPPDTDLPPPIIDEDALGRYGAYPPAPAPVLDTGQIDRWADMESGQQGGMRTGSAIWRNRDFDLPVEVIGPPQADQAGRMYVPVRGTLNGVTSTSYVPAEELAGWDGSVLNTSPDPLEVQRRVDELTGVARQDGREGNAAKDMRAALDEQVEPQVILDENGHPKSTTSRYEVDLFHAEIESRLAKRQRNIEAGQRLQAARRPSEQMGLDPNAGPLSAAAVQAVDGGASAAMAQAAAVQAGAGAHVKETAEIEHDAAAQPLPPPRNLREGLERIRDQRQAQQAQAQSGAPDVGQQAKNSSWQPAAALSAPRYRRSVPMNEAAARRTAARWSAEDGQSYQLSGHPKNPSLFVVEPVAQQEAMTHGASPDTGTDAVVAAPRGAQAGHDVGRGAGDAALPLDVLAGGGRESAAAAFVGGGGPAVSAGVEDAGAGVGAGRTKNGGAARRKPVAKPATVKDSLTPEKPATAEKSSSVERPRSPVDQSMRLLMERGDGSGSPDGLSGPEHLSARTEIVSALTGRPMAELEADPRHRFKTSVKEVERLLHEAAGIEGASLNDRRGAFSDFVDSWLGFAPSDKFVWSEEVDPEEGPDALLRTAANRNDGAEGRVFTAAQTDQVVGRILGRLGFPKETVTTVESFAALPQDIQADARKQDSEGGVKGVLHRSGSIWLVADQHSTEADIEETVLHELMGHKGVRALFGRQYVSAMNRLFLALGGWDGVKRIAASRGMSAQIDGYRESLFGEGRPEWQYEMRIAILTDELMASMAQRPVWKDRVKEVIGTIRQWLREHGFVRLARYGETDLLRVLQQGRQVMESKGAAPGQTVFSRSGNGASRSSGAFVAAPDGSIDFGEITPQMARAMRRQAGKIRLRQGDEKWGLTHIQSRHGKQFAALGFASAQDFVAHVAGAFNAIYKGDGAGLSLVLETGRTGGRLMIQLEPAADGDFYDVKTASPVRADQYEKQKPLWERAGTSAPTAQGSSLLPVGQSGSSSVANPGEDGTLPEREFRETERAYGGRTAWEKASASGRTKLNYRQWVQVRTPAFKKWFGDWENDPQNASKVIDPQTGEPMVVYHGSGSDFDVFDGSRLGDNTGYGDAMVGFHFSGNDSDADFYASMAARKNDLDRGVVRGFYLGLHNPLIVGFDESHGNAGNRTQYFLDDKNLAKEYAVENGHDGLIYQHGTNVDAGYTAIAFHPEQIKSATGNTGAFDPRNQDIRASQSGQSGQQPASAPIDRESLRAAMSERFPSLNKSVGAMLERGDRGQKGGAVLIERADANSIASVFASKTGRGMDEAVQMFRSEGAGDIQGFYDPRSGLTFLVGPNLTAQSAPAVLLHEMIHGQQRAGIDAKAMELLAKRGRIVARPAREFLHRVAARMADAGETDNAGEAAAYIVEQAVLEGRQAGFSAADGKLLDWIDRNIGRSVGNLVREFVAMVRAWGLRRGGYPRNLSVDDLVALARMGVKQAAMGDVRVAGGGLRSSAIRGPLLPVREEAEGYRAALEAAMSSMRSNIPPVKVMTTPPVLRVLGAQALPITISRDVVRKATNGVKHDVTMEAIRRLPEELANPVMVFDSATEPGSLVVLTEFKDGSGRPVMIAVGLNVKASKDGYEINRIASAYGRRAVEYMNFVERGLLRYRNTAKSPGWLSDNGLQLPNSLSAARGFWDSVPTEADVVNEPGIQFSRAGHARPASTITAAWDAPESSKMDDVIYTLQNKMVDMKRVVEAISAKIGQIADEWNPYLQEELFHGRSARGVTTFLKKEMRPLLMRMRANKIEMGALERYLHARHAPEANAHIARINPNSPDMQDGGSGMTNKEASDHIASIEPGRRAVLDALAKQVDAINANTRKLLVDSGLETAETVKAWEAAYKHYVPLQREDAETGGLSIGQGFSVRGSASKRRTGSKKAVADILANIALQRERAIVRAEKNRVAQANYALALKAPNPDFWMPINPDEAKVLNPAQRQKMVDELIGMGLDPTDAQNFVKEPVQRYVDPRTGLVSERINPALRGADNVLAVRVAGQDRFVFFNRKDERAQRMVHALKNLDADQLGRLLQVTSKLTRWFASVNTQYNPIFGVVNLTRDTQAALLQLSTTPIRGSEKAVLGNVLPAMRGIYATLRAERGDRAAPGNEWANLFEEFQAEGGRTGYRDQFSSSQARAEALQRELNPEGWMDGPLGKVFTADGKLKVPMAIAQKRAEGLFGWLSDYNDMMENGVRLAAYKAAKDKGMTKQQAASLAKNLTVNFNRKGQIATQAGAMYAFFNAAMQGTVRMAQTLAGPAGKKIILGGLTLGALQAVTLTLAGFDDDEPPEFVRERSLIIPIGGGKYVSIPMPLGFHAIPSTGRIATEWALSGFKDTAKRFGDFMAIFADAFNPIGNAGWSIQTIAPSAVDPFAALAENRDWTGKPIAREDFNSLRPSPGYTRAKDTASELSKAIAYWANLATGGTDYKPGIVSPTPDQIDYLIGQFTGGVGRESMKAEQVVTSLLTGEELPAHKIPLFGRFYGDTTGQSAEGTRFYNNLREVHLHRAEIEGRRRDRLDVSEYLRENPAARIGLSGAPKVENEVRKLRTAKRDALEKGQSGRVKMIDARITALMKQFNERVAAMG